MHSISLKEDILRPGPCSKSYDGHWVDGHMSGYGKYLFADGMTYEGILRNDWPCGEGTALYPNGAVYQGGWKNGLCEVW